MSQLAYNLNIIESATCKVVIVDKEYKYEHGTGVIIQREDKEYVYILTAKHCIFGKSLDYKREDISIKIMVKNNNGDYDEVELQEDDEIVCDTNNLNDIAVIVIKKHENDIFNSIKLINLINEHSIPNKCSFRGYPAPYNINSKNEPITIGMCEYIENNILSTNTKLDNTIYDDALYNLSGCSGGGVFTSYNGKVYMVGIVYEFNDLFQRIVVNSLGKYNEILKVSKYEELKFEEYYSEKEIPLSMVKDKYDKDKESWLKDRYIPDLHISGEIENHVKYIVQDLDVERNIINYLNNTSYELESMHEEIDYHKRDIRFHTVKDKLENLLTNLSEYKSKVDDIIHNILHNVELEKNKYTINLEEVYSIVDIIKKIESSNFDFINARKLREEIERVFTLNLESKIDSIIEIYNTKYSIFLGEPGTGKTHALSNIVRTHINNKSIAILIQAKKYQNFNSWKDIIIDCFGLSSSFSEDEIWIALENAAIQCELNKYNTVEKDNKQNLRYTEKVVICIDGIDECNKKDNWMNKIKELDLICNKYKRLRFIVSSRPYIFKSERLKNIIQIPPDGDVKVVDIFLKYIDKYNIRFEDEVLKKRIKWSIRDPFSLRLFSESYENEILRNNENINVTVTKLLKNKIDKIDLEINEKLEKLWGKSQFIIRGILLNLVTYLVENLKTNIEHNDLINLLKISEQFNGLGNNNISIILDNLNYYGIIYTIKEENENDLFDMPKIYYEISTQPLVDYLIAIKLNSIDIMYNKDIPELITDRIDAQKMYALMLLEEKDQLVGTNGIWENYSEDDELIKVQAFVISNIANEKALLYKDMIKSVSKKNTKNMRDIINYLVLEVCRIPNHPFNGIFIHDILMEYETPVDRDIIWSSPEFMKLKNDDIWEGNNLSISSINTSGLSEDDKFDGLPLIYAWNLTNLDIKVREQSKIELTKWGIMNSSEFIKLLEISYNTNDPHMKEELLLCTVGVISSQEVDNNDLKKLCNWAMKNIFHKEKIQENKNSVIRFCARIIIELGYKYSLVTHDELKLSRPPYVYNPDNFIKMNKEVINSDKESFEPITGDFDWYVINNAFDGFFNYDKEETKEEIEENYNLLEYYNKIINSYIGLDEIDSNLEEIDELNEDDVDLETMLESTDIHEVKIGVENYSKVAQEFLINHGKNVGKEFILPKKFAISVAIDYLYKMGWKKEKVSFYNKTDGVEKLGFDIAVGRQYWPATHGSRSNIMTTAEKYTWSAIHEIQGYLADRLPYYCYDDVGEIKKILNEYSCIVDVGNTYLSSKKSGTTRNLNYPYFPNELNPKIDELNEDTEYNIVHWIKDAKFPDFEPWIKASDDDIKDVSNKLKGNWACLYNYTVVTEKLTRTDSILWINSYIIKNDEFELMKSEFNTNGDNLKEYFMNTNDNEYSTPDTGIYMDPATLTLQDWVNDLYSKLVIKCSEKEQTREFNIYKTVSKMTYKDMDDEEIICIVPSKKIRQILNINQTDSLYYKNEKDEIVVFNSETGIRWSENQNILYANYDELNAKLDEYGYKMFWIIKILREPSFEVRDKNKDFFYDRYCGWIVTENPFNTIKIYDGHKH